VDGLDTFRAPRHRHRRARAATLAVTLHRAGAGGSRWTSTDAVLPLPGVRTLILNVGLGPATAYTTSASYQVS
jgi:hypothetical protein